MEYWSDAKKRELARSLTFTPSRSIDHGSAYEFGISEIPYLIYAGVTNAVILDNKVYARSPVSNEPYVTVYKMQLLYNTEWTSRVFARPLTHPATDSVNLRSWRDLLKRNAPKVKTLYHYAFIRLSTMDIDYYRSLLI